MKRRGKMVITLELLKELLKLDSNEQVLNIYRTSSDKERDCFTILIGSETESNHTMKVAEDSCPPFMILKNHDKPE